MIDVNYLFWIRKLNLELFQEVKLRFLVIDRLGSDLDKFFKGGENPWPFQTVLRVGLMVLDSLEYVHSKGYAHNDIKVMLIHIVNKFQKFIHFQAQNLLLGIEDKEKIYLVDFGIACKYRLVAFRNFFQKFYHIIQWIPN